LDDWSRLLQEKLMQNYIEKNIKHTKYNNNPIGSPNCADNKGYNNQNIKKKEHERDTEKDS